MKKYMITAACLALCGPAAAAPPEGYELVWQDEFDQLNLSASGAAWRDHFKVWNVRYLDGNGDKGYKLGDLTETGNGKSISEYLRVQGQWGPGPFLHRIEAGKLILSTYPNPVPNDFDGLPYLASMISGQDLHRQRYGYWEVRFRASRIPSGHHFAIWLLPDTYSWPPEIDLVEIVASEPGVFFANTHGIEAPAISAYKPDAPSGWHTIGFEWTEDEMVWRLDDKEVRRHPASISDGIKFYFLASFEIGGKWPGPVQKDAQWPGRFEIDYLRIYQR